MFEDDEEIQDLLEQRTTPTLEQIAKLARKRNIESVDEFWDLFDSIRKIFVEKRSYEGDWT